MPKSLIYYCHFGTVEHANYLKLSLVSLLEIGCYQGDIAIFTDNVSIVKNTLGHELIKRVKVFRHTQARPLFARFCIDAKYFNEYESVMYLDVDILISKNIDNILKNCKQDTIHYVDECEKIHISNISNWHGGYLYDGSEDIQYAIVANSGLFCFKPSKKVFKFFNLIQEYSYKISEENYKEYGDQPVYAYLLTLSNEVVADDLLLKNKQFMTHGLKNLNIHYDFSFIHHNSSYTDLKKLKSMRDSLPVIYMRHKKIIPNYLYKELINA